MPILKHYIANFFPDTTQLGPSMRLLCKNNRIRFTCLQRSAVHPTSVLSVLTFKAAAAAAAAKSLQSCPTLCNPIEGSPTGSSVPGILQARTLGWVAISFSNAWKWKVKVKSLSRVPLLATQLLATRLLVTPWTVAYQAPPSMGFSRQEYWSGSPLEKFF